jgi:hypothetical protein
MKSFSRLVKALAFGLALTPASALMVQAWLSRADGTKAQTYAALGITYLTAVLIVATGFYAWATWETLQVLRRDFEFRIRPLVSFQPWADILVGTDTTRIRLKVKSSNAPAQLVSATLYYAGGMITGEGQVDSPTTREGIVALDVANRIVSIGEEREFNTQVVAPLGWWYMAVLIQYQDIYGVRQHTQFGDSDQLFIGQAPFDAGEWRRRAHQALHLESHPEATPY